jgi:2-polyprenyl-6-methoxyphenol hydroxylase-like FAD-dependent oxidoreductase
MTDVVIAGAGPNGLLLAGELALAGVRPVVLDALPGPSDEPKANGLVGQVVRALDMRGLYEGLGGPPPAPEPLPAFTFSGIPVSFAEVADNPMYALLVSQPRVIRHLTGWVGGLGVHPRWGHEVTDVLVGDGDVTVCVSGPDGPYRIDTRFLVAADGGRSRIRKAVGIDFPGVTSDMTMRLAHVTVPDDVPMAFGHNRFDNGLVVFARFEAERAMLGTVEFGPTEATADTPMTLPELRDSVGRVSGIDVPVGEPGGAGPHALRRVTGQNTRQAQRYRAGNVFLLGDAAHVHSAMGGPGLNLGLQDAMNLGWKLAAVVNGWAPDRLLDSYDTERRPVGERVMMHSLSQIALMLPGPEIGALRELVSELVAAPQGAEHIARLLAGSDVRYDVGDGHSWAGRFVPELTLHDGRRIAALLHQARPVLIDAAGGPFAEAARAVAHRVDIHTCGHDRAPKGLLVRPDGYVAWAADAATAADVRAMHDALRRWCGYDISVTG